MAASIVHWLCLEPDDADVPECPDGADGADVELGELGEEEAWGRGKRMNPGVLYIHAASKNSIPLKIKRG